MTNYDKTNGEKTNHYTCIAVYGMFIKTKGGAII